MPNRLANESSPYLKQHQENPVAWFPWGADALEKSRTEDKPIFLSIGYSACHWCHVMEHESFENTKIADFLNEHYVSIKVDREERPDLDQIYMQCVMALTGHGGWPLSAFLTPDQEFFYGGTYWPAGASRGMPGFDQVLARVLDAFQQKRQAVTEQAKQITEMLQSAAPASEPYDLMANTSLIDEAISQMARQFDTTWGGFGSSPKFPPCMDLQLLLRLHQQGPNEANVAADQLLPMVETTLGHMASGGIFDHLGGGFARYSVDAQWLVPHFEKMLYDNAQLANVYSLAFLATNQSCYRRIAEETLNYLLRDMSSPQGGLYSSEDADSEGEEGRFYVWTPTEIIQILGPELGQRFCQLYDVTESGNFEGQNILHLPLPYETFAEQSGMEEQALRKQMNDAKAQLLEERGKRVAPGKDDKILTSWNGLAIDALARASMILDRADYRTAAQRAAHFVLDQMSDADGRLQHTYRLGQARLNAYLDDYSYMVNALITLYQADHDTQWLEQAKRLADLMSNHFAKESGGFYYTSDDHESLIVRPSETQDSATPSGNSMAASALLRLGRLLNEPRFVDLAAGTLRAAMHLLKRSPLGHSQMLFSLNEWQQSSSQYVLLLPESPNEETENLLASLRKRLFPHQYLIVTAETPSIPPVLLPAVGEKRSVDNQPTLYVCHENRCDQPRIGSQAILACLQVP